MTNKIKIRCLFGVGSGDSKWQLIEALEHEIWNDGYEDFERSCDDITNWRELTIEIDDARVQELLGGTDMVQGEVVEDSASAEDEKAMATKQIVVETPGGGVMSVPVDPKTGGVRVAKGDGKIRIAKP